MTTDLHVRVPGSTSNLGPGFDCLGLAVDRYLTIEWVHDGGGEIAATGERPPEGMGDRLARALAEGPVALGLPARGLLSVHSEIPVGRGLGSSAALEVALEVLRALLREKEPDRPLLVDTVSGREGHPDNAAPSVWGGLVAVASDAGVIRISRLDLSPEIGWAWAAPATPADTGVMRAALPRQIPTAKAVRNAARLLHLAPALASGDGVALRWAMEDELHVPARIPLIVGAEEVRRAARVAGAWACTISGAGSGMIAAAPLDCVSEVAEAMGAAFEEVAPEPAGVVSAVLTPERAGAVWGPGGAPL